MRLRTNPLLIIVIGVCAALLLPALFMDGMFSDGTQYAAISRNFSERIGTFWHPAFTATHYPYFTEQPPLMFALQGSFFSLFGNSLYTERIYCLIAAIINAILLAQCWKLLTDKKETTWLPLVLWFTMPVIFYAFINNLEECTMSVFILFALHAILKTRKAPEKEFRWWLLAGFFLTLSGLTKGIQGMFLLAAPLWVMLAFKEKSWGMLFKRTAYVLAVPLVFAAVALASPEIRDSLHTYFESRFTKTFAGVTAHGDTRFHLLYELLLDTLPAIALVAVLYLAGRKNPAGTGSPGKNKQKIVFLFLCGFSGILPLMVTREQRGFYLAAPLPVIALALALCVAEVAERWTLALAQKKRLSNLLSTLGLLIVAGSVFVAVRMAGRPKRDADKIAAVHEIASHTGESVMLQTSIDISYDWSLVGYGERYHHLSFTENPGDAPWILLSKGSSAPENTVQIPLKTPLFDLYQRMR